MQTYQIDTHISRDGIISLPSTPNLHNKRVRLVIIPLEEKKAAGSVRNASEDTPEFLRKYSEKLEMLSGEEAENFKRENPIPEFLRKCSDFSEKDFLDNSSGAGQENAKKSLRYEYLMKKYGMGDG